MRNGRVRIAYVMDHYAGPNGGTEHQVMEIIRRLDQTRFEPQMFVFRETRFSEECADRFPCPLNTLHIGSIKSGRAVRKLLGLSKLCREQGIRVVHTFFNDAAIAVPPFGKLGRARVITSRRDMGFWYTESTLRLIRMSNRFVDRVVTNSEAIKVNVSHNEHVPTEKITVIYNTHDPERFREPATPGFREGLGIGPADPVVGMVANLSPVKRHGDLLRAFRHVLRDIPNAHLVLVGDGPESAHLDALARELAIRHRVHFLGRVQGVIPLIKHFDLCVLTSESEGFSNAIIEYMGAGKPLIATDAGGNPELVKDGRTGRLVPVGNVQALASCIRDIICNPDHAARLGRAGQEHLSDLFSKHDMIRSYEDLYGDLAT